MQTNQRSVRRNSPTGRMRCVSHYQVMEFRSEKKCQPNQPGNSIQTEVGIAYLGAR